MKKNPKLLTLFPSLLLTLFLTLALLFPQFVRADAALDFYPGGSFSAYYVEVDAWDGGVNFRYGPGVSYDKIISNMIPNGTVLYVTRESNASNGNTWGYVQYNGMYGWIALSETSWLGYTYNPGSSSSGSSSTDTYHVPTHVSYDVTAAAPDGQLNIRTGPGVEYQKLRDNPIPNGTVLHIHWEDTASNGNSWGFTFYDGTYGWVALTQVTNETRTASDTLTVNYRVTVNAPDGGINFRNGPGTEYPLLQNSMIPNGTVLPVATEYRNSQGKFWGQVTYNGRVGVVTMQQVDPIEENQGSASTIQSGAVADRLSMNRTAHTATADDASSASQMNTSLFLLFGLFGIVVLSGAGAAGFALYRRRKE